MGVIEVPGHPAWGARTPHAPAVVALDEGPRLLRGVLRQSAHALEVGQHVRFVAEAAGDPAGPLPYLEPEGS